MDPGIRLLLVLSLAITAVFVAVMVVALKFRKRQDRENLEYSARELRPRIPEDYRDRPDFLYAIRRDFSASSVGFIVRDSNDTDLATVTFHHSFLGLSPAIRIVAADRVYVGVVRLAWRQRIGLYDERDVDRNSPICVRERRGGVSYYEGDDLPRTEIASGRAFNRVFPVSRGGQPIGVVGALDGLFDRGRIGVLPGSVPLPIQIFMISFV